MNALPIFSLLIFFFFFGCSSSNFPATGGTGLAGSSPGTSGVSVPESKIVRKGNLEFLLMNRNRAEVETLLGPPQNLFSRDGILVDWEYRLAVYDEVTQVVFGWSRVIITFDSGLCSEIQVELEQLPEEDLE
tara:strand:- start:2595 stop:2990 length:396 start_codon:yes stop_codon:yes gene_type:complete